MKIKLLTLLAVINVGFVASSFGQGYMLFNGSTSRVTTNGTAIGGTIGNMAIAPLGYDFQVFWSLTNSYSGGSLTGYNASSVVNNSTTSLGIIAGGTATAFALTPNVGDVVFLQIFGWTHGFTLASAQTTPGAYWGSTGVSGPLTMGTSFTATPTFGAGLFSGFALTAVPEPSTMVLAGLGAASLLLFRRRKQA